MLHKLAINKIHNVHKYFLNCLGILYEFSAGKVEVCIVLTLPISNSDKIKSSKNHNIYSTFK